MKLSNNIKKAVFGVALMVSATSASAASYNIENSQAGWLASLGSIGSITVGTGIFVGVGCAPGVACSDVTVNGLPGVSFTQNGAGSASYDGGLLNNLSSSGGYLEWAFAAAQNGWGGTFEMATGNAGLQFIANDLNLGWIDVTTVLANQPLNGFLGFTSTDRFKGVRVAALPQVGAGPSGTSYKMTDVSIGSAAPVPSPAPLALLFMSGLSWLGFVGAKRKR